MSTGIQSYNDYERYHGAAQEGQRVDGTLTNTESKAVEGATIAAGRAVVQGTADNQCKLPSAAGQLFLGISLYTSAGTVDDAGAHEYQVFAEANFIDFGKVWVYTEQTVTIGDDVFFRHTAGTAPLDVLGRFRKDSSGGDADQIVGAVFATSATAGELVQLKITSAGLGRSVIPDSSETLTATTAAIALTTEVTYFDTTLGTMAASLADGVEGQTKFLYLKVDGGDVTVTPANYFNGTDFALNDAGDFAELRFTGTSWHLIRNGGVNAGLATIVATSGAIPLTASTILFDTTAGVSTSTLADGVENQRMTLTMTVDGGDQVLTPANFLNGATITFDDAGDTIELLFANGSWMSIGTATATIA
jgi:hypothetical protein